MLVAAREVGVGEVDVAELVPELPVRPHEVYPARADVAGVEGNVADTEQMLREVAAFSPDAEDPGAPLRHVLHGDRDAGSTRFFEGSLAPALERASWGRRVGGDDNLFLSPDPGGEPRGADEGLAGIEAPDPLPQRRVQREDRDAVFVGQIIQVGFLVGVPAVVHHYLHAVVPGRRRPAVDPVQPERIQRPRAEYDRHGHYPRPRNSRNRAMVEGEWFW